MVLVPLDMLASVLLSVVNMLRNLSQESRGEAKRCSLHLSVATQVSTARQLISTRLPLFIDLAFPARSLSSLSYF